MSKTLMERADEILQNMTDEELRELMDSVKHDCDSNSPTVQEYMDNLLLSELTYLRVIDENTTKVPQITLDDFISRFFECGEDFKPNGYKLNIPQDILSSKNVVMLFDVNDENASYLSTIACNYHRNNDVSLENFCYFYFDNVKIRRYLRVKSNVQGLSDENMIYPPFIMTIDRETQEINILVESDISPITEEKYFSLMQNSNFVL